MEILSLPMTRSHFSEMAKMTRVHIKGSSQAEWFEYSKYSKPEKDTATRKTKYIFFFQNKLYGAFVIFITLLSVGGPWLIGPCEIGLGF